MDGLAAAAADGRMKVLVLGGTNFVGRAIANHAVSLGHSVTIANRGQSTPTAAELFGDRVEHIVGDRVLGDLRELTDGGRSWDVCIDVNGYLPLAVRKSSRALAGRVGKCVDDDDHHHLVVMVVMVV